MAARSSISAPTRWTDDGARLGVGSSVGRMMSRIGAPSTRTGYIDASSFLEKPTPEVAFACGSRSTMRTLRSQAATHAPRLIAVVVFPTPPFWFASATILVIVSRERQHDEEVRRASRQPVD